MTLWMDHNAWRNELHHYCITPTEMEDIAVFNIAEYEG